MITCPRCGLNLRAGTPACPRCGTLFSQGGPAGPVGPASQAAPVGNTDGAIPAWVRQVQAQQQAASPAPAQQPPVAGPPAGAPGYGPAPSGRGGGGNLFDEGALPEWLRQGANGAPQPGYGTAYPAPAPGYNPAPGYGAPPPQRLPGEMNAHALIDDRALPAWMNQPAGSGGAMSANGPNGLREGMDARSLIDEGALPQWLRGPQGQQSGQWGIGPIAPAAQEPLPVWVAQPAAPAGPLGPIGVGSAGIGPIGPVGPMGQERQPGMSAGHFADESALPEWLRAQGNGPGMPGGSGPANSANGRPAMAANNLVDPSAMPAWVRSGSASAEARYSASAAGAHGAAPRRPPDSSWLTDVRVPAAPGPVRGPGDPLATEELPSWLRKSPRNAAGPAADAAPARQPEAPSPADPFVQPGNLREDELPPWVKRAQANGQAAQGTPQAGQQRGFGPAAQMPQRPGVPDQQGYGQGYGREEWDGQSSNQYPDQYGNQYGNQYPGGDDGSMDGSGEPYQEWEDGSQARERRGFFGRRRRK